MKGIDKLRAWVSAVSQNPRVAKYAQALRQTGYAKVALLLAAGVLLLLLSLPGQTKKTKKPSSAATSAGTAQESTEQDETNEQYASRLSAQLEELLGDVAGVGEVEVMITLKGSSQTVVNKDVSQSESDSERTGTDSDLEQQTQSQSDEETVLVEDSEGNQTPYVVQRLEPEIEGIVVICDGGSDPEVVSNITCAAQVLFSVSAHKVKVMKKI